MSSLYFGSGEARRFQNLNSQRRSQRQELEGKDRRGESQDKKLINFIWANNEWVDKDILERLNSREEAAINEVLNQIHSRSIDEAQRQGKVEYKGVRSYSEMLQEKGGYKGASNSSYVGPWEQVSYKKFRKASASIGKAVGSTIFLHGIPEDTTGREIWNLFNSCGVVHDIVLPRRRDVNGKRFGFLKTSTEKEAGAIINNAKMDRKLGAKIKMTINGKSEVKKGEEQKVGEENKRAYSKQEQGQTEKKQEDNNTFEKKMFEFIEVEVDEEVESALMECKIGYTWFDMGVSSLQDSLNDMGLGKYKVISLSKRKFLIRKDKKESWEELEKTDLSVWFCKLRQYDSDDHIISRVVWLECRGLPMPAWKEENLMAFTDRLGRWISWSYQGDGLGEFFNPLICLDTHDWKLVYEDMKILYKGESKEICFEEVKDEKYLLGKVLPMEFSQEIGKKEEKAESEKEHEPLEEKIKGREIGDLSQVDQNVNSSIDNTNDQDVVKGKELDVYPSPEEMKDKLYEGIRQVQSSSDRATEESDKKENSDKSVICGRGNTEELGNSQSTLCVGISKKLRVQSNRWRPRKKIVQQRNPFEIGTKFRVKKASNVRGRKSFKNKGKVNQANCLQITPSRVVGSSVQEALEILA